MKILHKEEADKLDIDQLIEYHKDLKQNPELDSLISDDPEYLDKFSRYINRRKAHQRLKASYRDNVVPFNEYVKLEDPFIQSNKNESKINPKKYQIKGQFLPLTYDGFFGNEVLMKKLANKSLLFLILLKNVVNWEKNEKLNLYQRYYISRKLLVASISKTRLAKMLGVDERTIRRWTQALVADGLLQVGQVTCDDDDEKRYKYNVYILGKINEDGKEKYFYETGIDGQKL